MKLIRIYSLEENIGYDGKL